MQFVKTIILATMAIMGPDSKPERGLEKITQFSDPPPISASRVALTQGLECPSIAGGNIGRCLPCYEQCLPENLGFVTDTPMTTILDGAFGRGTQCFCRPPNSIVPAPAEAYAFLEDWTTSGAVLQSQPGEFPFSSGQDQLVLIRFWWQSVRQSDGTQGPRLSLTDTDVHVWLVYWPSDGDPQEGMVDATFVGQPVCNVLIDPSQNSAPDSHVMAWTIPMPEEVDFAYVSIRVPIMEDECFFADWDFVLKSE